MDLGAILTRHARYRPDRLAVVLRDQRLTGRNPPQAAGLQPERLGGFLSPGFNLLIFQSDSTRIPTWNTSGMSIEST